MAGANTSTLDLGNKSPPPGPLLDKTGVADTTGPGDEGNGVRETTESITKGNKPSFHQETDEDEEVARVREGLTADPKMQQSRQREADEIAEEKEDQQHIKRKCNERIPRGKDDLWEDDDRFPRKENSDNSENSPVKGSDQDCHSNARDDTRSHPSSKGNRRGDIGSSDDNNEGDNRGQRVSPQPRPDYYKNARSDTRSPASSGQEKSAHERPGQPDAKLDHTHHCLLVTLANSNLKVNYRTT